MGILGRGIEDMDKLLRAFGSEGVKGFVKWKEESPVVHKSLYLQKNLEIISKQKNFVYFGAFEAAVAVTTVCVSIFPFLPRDFLMPFSHLSQYSRPVLPSLAAISKRIGHTFLFGSCHFLIN